VNRGRLLAYCLGKPGAWRDEPWEGHFAAKVGDYIGRSGWNTLDLNKTIDDAEILEAIDDSYRTVVAKLPKRLRP
jgi:predicted DNA-binding protein (MmcQ/YjbR family)